MGKKLKEGIYVDHCEGFAWIYFKKKWYLYSSHWKEWLLYDSYDGNTGQLNDGCYYEKEMIFLRHLNKKARKRLGFK